LSKVQTTETTVLPIEYVRCNLCGADEPDLLFSGVERRFGLGGSFNVVRCKHCGLVYVNPRPTAASLSYYYPSEQYYAYKRLRAPHRLGQYMRQHVKTIVLAQVKGYPLGNLQTIKRALPWLGKILKLVIGRRFDGFPTYVKGGRLLDVGCGVGSYLYSLRELGWEVQGIEIDKQAASYAKKALGLEVLSDPLEEAGFPDMHFDVVIMRQVLEHLSDPFGTLVEVYRVLKASGKLIVELPNFESFQAALFRDKWFHLDLPRHLYHFSPCTLQTMLCQAGFSEITIVNLLTTSGITGSLQYIWNAWTRNPKGNRIRWSKALELCLWPLAFVIARAGYGEMLRAIAVKR
jgi:2-polyprenyl-3-methyl-5-hydroxy-6-metoxy-1,4-benzoquinol methylase